MATKKAGSAKKHRCRFTFWGWTSRTLIFRCSCGAEKNRRMTRKEKSKVWDWKLGSVHNLWFAFVETFGSGDEDHPWKFQGWEMMQKVREWAKRRKGVRIVGVDDSTFSSSLLVFLEHQEKAYYHGTTVIYIPQNGGVPGSFFLYPGHRHNLQRVLAEIATESRKVQSKQAKVTARHNRYLNGLKV